MDRKLPQHVTATLEPPAVQAIDKIKSSAWGTVLPYIAIACFASLIFWRLGLVCYESDDVSQTVQYCQCLPTSFSQYIDFIGSLGRGYLHWIYHFVFELCQCNLDVAVRAFVAIFVVSAFYLFHTLRRMVSLQSALIGSLLYLCLFAKYRAIVVYNAQMFIPLVFSAIVMLRILTGKLSRGLQCLIISPIFWAGIHFYEILMVVVPAFPFFWLGPSIIKRQWPRWQDLCYSAVPAAITAVHIILIAHAREHPWDTGHKDFSKLPLYLISLLNSSIDKMFGNEHWSRLQANLLNFFTLDVRHDHSLWLPLIAVLVFSLWIIYSVWLQPKQYVLSERLVTFSLLWTGLYLCLLAPLITVAEFTDDVPSRLLFLPCLGLALAVAAGLDLIRNMRFYKLCTTAALIWCVLEALAFTAIVQQGITAMEVDRHITSLFTSIGDFRLKSGSHVFISLPFAYRRPVDWFEFKPTYYFVDPEILWVASNLKMQGQTYDYGMRLAPSLMGVPTSLKPLGMCQWALQTLKQEQSEKLTPFYLDDKDRLRPITTISFVDKQGRVVKRINTGLNGHVPPEIEMQIKLDLDPPL